jgi:hypothetical protein
MSYPTPIQSSPLVIKRWLSKRKIRKIYRRLIMSLLIEDVVYVRTH